VDIERAVRAIDPTAIVTETLIADVPRGDDVTVPFAPAPGASRGVYHFLVRLADAVYDDPRARTDVVRVLEQLKPAHVTYALHTNSPDKGFRFGIDAFGRDAFFTV
jgi:phosphoglycolate phosphatase-like HAD superfamily hydrolase